MGMDDRNWYVDDSDRHGVGFSQPQFRLSFGPKTPPVTKYLIIANIAIFLAQMLDYMFTGRHHIIEYFAFSPQRAVGDFEVWRFFTYSFLHGSPFHILINMFILWMFAREVEYYLGSWQFLVFYILCGLGGSLFTCYIPDWYIKEMVGASASVLGTLVTWWFLWPNRVVLLMFVFPVKIKWIVPIIALLDILGATGGAGSSNTAHLAHIGGMVSSAAFFLILPKIESLFIHRKAVTAFREAESEFEIRRRVDDLLEKINYGGIGSLTDKEKEFLKDASRRFGK